MQDQSRPAVRLTELYDPGRRDFSAEFRQSFVFGKPNPRVIGVSAQIAEVGLARPQFNPIGLRRITWLTPARCLRRGTVISNAKRGQILASSGLSSVIPKPPLRHTLPSALSPVARALRGRVGTIVLRHRGAALRVGPMPDPFAQDQPGAGCFDGAKA